MDGLSMANRFVTEDRIESVKPLGIGNINNSFLAIGKRKYVLKRMNTNVFRDPYGVMENIRLVTSHIRAKLEKEGGDTERGTIRFLPSASDGTLLAGDDEGGLWRMYAYIDDVVTIQNAASTEEAYRAAHTFGHFQAQLSDFEADKLTETIPDFHNTARRWDAFVKAVEEDRANRAAEVETLIRQAEALSYLAEPLVKKLESGILPVRVTHNDTKINNVLFDKTTGEGVCVIDLDTVMPATALYDFGDMVRSGANATDEEDTDLSHVYLDMDYYEAFLRGFADGTEGKLTAAETEGLAESALVLTFELAIRFLGDYLNGDVYFSIRKPRHNAERAANQLWLAQDMVKKYEKMQRLTEKL